MNFKEEIAKEIGKLIKIYNFEIYSFIEIPPTKDKGDFSFPCFRLSKILKKSPNIIAYELSQDLKNISFIEEVKVEGGYVNFYIKKLDFVKIVIEKAIQEGENYGRSNKGKNKNIVIDYSSPNVAKYFHVGHLRSTVIGNALYNIFNFLGYNSIGINHLGDWGTQFGKLIVAYINWSNEDRVRDRKIQELNEIYVKFHDEASKNEKLNDEARQWLLKMQNKDEEALNLWKLFCDISIEEFKKVYDRLNIKFDYVTGESFYNDKINKVIDDLENKNLLLESEGAKIVNLEDYNMPSCLIVRRDGGSLYHTRDLAAVKYRMENYNFEKCVYITGADQSLHFKQLFKIVELMGYDWYKKLDHVPFGLVSLESGKLSTRKGNVVLMQDLLDEAVNKTKKVIEEKNPNLDNKDVVAEQVGIGAIIFNDLYNTRIKDVVFSWDRMLNFEGETGPYVQYTHVRAISLLEKGPSIDFSNIDFSVLTDDITVDIIKSIYNYNDKLIEATLKLEPYILTRYLVEISQKFNKFYHEKPILSSEENIKNARLVLVYVVKNIIFSGLGLLGIEAPNKM